GDEPIWPERFGPYRRVLNAEPRRGAMGVVFKAENAPPLTGFVAVKTILRFAPDPERQRLFADEMRACDAARHPSILRVLTHGTFESNLGTIPYYVMDWVESPHTITDPAVHAELDVVGRVELAIKICQGVEAAHKA